MKKNIKKRNVLVGSMINRQLNFYQVYFSMKHSTFNKHGEHCPRLRVPDRGDRTESQFYTVYVQNHKD